MSTPLLAVLQAARGSTDEYGLRGGAGRSGGGTSSLSPSALSTPRESSGDPTPRGSNSGRPARGAGGGGAEQEGELARTSGGGSGASGGSGHGGGGAASVFTTASVVTALSPPAGAGAAPAPAVSRPGRLPAPRVPARAGNAAAAAGGIGGAAAGSSPATSGVHSGSSGCGGFSGNSDGLRQLQALLYSSNDDIPPPPSPPPHGSAAAAASTGGAAGDARASRAGSGSGSAAPALQLRDRGSSSAGGPPDELLASNSAASQLSPSALSRSPSTAAPAAATSPVTAAAIGALAAGRVSVDARTHSGGTLAGGAVALGLSGLSGYYAGGMSIAPGGAASTVRQPSKLGGGAGGSGRGGGGGASMASGSEAVEWEVEEAVMANRRVLDERGALLDEVTIDRVLGFGSMGMVYHGRLYDTKVVVKLIEHGAGLLGKEKERGRLARQEAAVSRMLLHPNVVTTYDACTGAVQPGRLAAKLGRPGGGGGGGGASGVGGSRAGGRQRYMTVMVQEFCELGTLRDALNKRRHGLAGPSPESLPLLLRVALDIANGMKHLASLRIIHVDLKAENVLLAGCEAGPERPHGFVAKVADFGLARVLAPGEDETGQGIHGTVSHMPPEAMRGTRFSLATDVFSFGVVLWELYTSESPYRGLAPHDVVEAVCEHGERPPWPPGSPPELVALAEDCWHADPHHRPSFFQIVERLRHMLAPAVGPQMERCGSELSCMTEESDELEAALRQQRRAGPSGLASALSGSSAKPPGVAAVAAAAAAPSEAGSDATTARHGGGAAGAGAGMPTVASSRYGGGGGFGGGGEGGEGGGGAGVPRVAPRDPLGRLLWALCQQPTEAPTKVAGPGDSEQWVLQVQEMVARAQEEGGEAGGTRPPTSAGFT